MILHLLGLMLTIIGQAFFSSAEIALVSSDQIFLRRLAKRGHRSAKRVLKLKASPERLLITTLIGTSLMMILSSMNVTVMIRHYLPDTEHVELLTIALLTPLVIVFSEIIPKGLAQSHANHWAMGTSATIETAAWLISPIRWFFTKYAHVLLRFLKVPRGIGLDDSYLRKEELREIVKALESQRTDLDRDEIHMISNILDISHTTAADMMMPLIRVAAVAETDTLQRALTIFNRHRRTRLPVYRDRIDEIVGVLDVFDFFQQPQSTTMVGTIAKKPLFVPETQELGTLFRQLQSHQVPMAVVVDEFGGAVGIVTLEDILEEIVGEIDDEYDETQTFVKKTSENKFVVDGRLPMQELNKMLPTHPFEQEEVETVAGLLLHHFKKFPSPGEEFSYQGYTFRCLQVSSKRIESVLIFPVENPDGEAQT